MVEPLNTLYTSTVTVHNVVVLNTYQVGQVRRPVVLEVNILLLSVELILHLRMLTMHAISSLVNVLQHQIQEVVNCV